MLSFSYVAYLSGHLSYSKKEAISTNFQVAVKRNLLINILLNVGYTFSIGFVPNFNYYRWIADSSRSSISGFWSSFKAFYGFWNSLEW